MRGLSGLLLAVCLVGSACGSQPPPPAASVPSAAPATATSPTAGSSVAPSAVPATQSSGGASAAPEAQSSVPASTSTSTAVSSTPATAPPPTPGPRPSPALSQPLTSTEIGAFEDALAADVVARAGIVADLGVERWAWIDAFLRRTLADASEKAGIAAGTRQIASISHAQTRIATELGGTGLAAGLAFGLVEATVGNPSTRQNLDLPVDSTQEQTAGGERTSARTSGRLATSTTGSRISADVEIDVAVSVYDASSGALLRRSSFRTTGTIEFDLCPDASGAVRGHVRLTVAGASGGSGSAETTIEADVVGSVGEDAYLNSVDAQGTTTSSTTPSGGGSARTSTVSAGFRAGVGRDGTIDAANADAHGQVDSETDRLTDAEVTDAYRQVGSAAGIAIGVIASKAQKQWQGGACVEIRSTETGRNVRPRERVPFTATLFHKVERREIDKPIVATFVGIASAQPLDTPVRPPMQVLFIAGRVRDQTGTVTLTSTSNRGIGTLDVTFKVVAGWFVDQPSGGGHINGQKCGDPPGEWIVTGTYEMQGFKGTQRWVFTIGPDEQTGTYTYVQTSKGKPAGSPVTIFTKGQAKGDVTLSIQEDGRAHMHLIERSHTYTATTSAGGTGAALPVPLEESDLTWEPGGTCP